MQSSAFGRWARTRPLDSHVVLPAFIGLLMIGLYFSHVPLLQNIVAPVLHKMPPFSSRELGALELLQDVFLLGIIFFALRATLASKDLLVKMFAFLLLITTIFTLLEEIDYGAPFIEYFTGQHGSLEMNGWNRNWHNRTSISGVQNVSYLKLASNIIILVGFVFAPLFFSNSRQATLRLLVPSRWMILTVILIALLAMLAHSLDRAGWDIIGGNPGILQKNISEFRELNIYYLMLLYTAILYERIVAHESGIAIIRRGKPRSH